METTETTEKRPRGFAALTPEKRREIAAKGGQSAHKQGKAYKFTTETAKLAGRKGGQARRARAAD